MGFLGWFTHSGGNLVNRYDEVKRVIQKLDAHNKRQINEGIKKVRSLRRSSIRSLERELPANQVRDLANIIIFCNAQINALRELLKKVKVEKEQKPAQPTSQDLKRRPPRGRLHPAFAR